MGANQSTVATETAFNTSSGHQIQVTVTIGQPHSDPPSTAKGEEQYTPEQKYALAYWYDLYQIPNLPTATRGCQISPDEAKLFIYMNTTPIDFAIFTRRLQMIKEDEVEQAKWKWCANHPHMKSGMGLRIIPLVERVNGMIGKEHFKMVWVAPEEEDLLEMDGEWWLRPYSV